eukprot:scaffold4547_cov103-Cylindrotheca_fusiformis.AAC.4
MGEATTFSVQATKSRVLFYNDRPADWETGGHWGCLGCPCKVLGTCILRNLEFQRCNGHRRVPPSQEYPELATWVKSQRRQYTLFINGQKSQMTSERIAALEAIDFATKRSH